MSNNKLLIKRVINLTLHDVHATVFYRLHKTLITTFCSIFVFIYSSYGFCITSTDCGTSFVKLVLIVLIGTY